jgi:competence protein ComEC
MASHPDMRHLPRYARCFTATAPWSTRSEQAALGLLAFDPGQLFTASFQMTFVCVLIVAAIGLPLVERTSRFYRRARAHWDADDSGATLPPRVAQFRVDLRLIAGRLAHFIGTSWSLNLVRGVTILSLRTFELILISAVKQIGFALRMAHYFHRATTIGLPANIAVAPLTQLLMPTARRATIATSMWAANERDSE